jgi:hypothetical protein
MKKHILVLSTLLLIPQNLFAKWGAEIKNDYGRNLLVKFKEKQAGLDEYVLIQSGSTIFIETTSGGKRRLVWIDLEKDKKIESDDFNWLNKIKIKKLDEESGIWEYSVIEKPMGIIETAEQEHSKGPVSELTKEEVDQLKSKIDNGEIRTYQQYMVPVPVKNNTKKTISVGIEWGNYVDLKPGEKKSINIRSPKRADTKNEVYIFWTIKEKDGGAYRTKNRYNNPESITISADGKKFDITVIDFNTSQKKELKNEEGPGKIEDLKEEYLTIERNKETKEKVEKFYAETKSLMIVDKKSRDKLISRIDALIEELSDALENVKKRAEELRLSSVGNLKYLIEYHETLYTNINKLYALKIEKRIENIREMSIGDIEKKLLEQQKIIENAKKTGLTGEQLKQEQQLIFKLKQILAEKKRAEPVY